MPRKKINMKYGIGGNLRRVSKITRLNHHSHKKMILEDCPGILKIFRLALTDSEKWYSRQDKR